MQDLKKKRKPQPLTKNELDAFLGALGPISRREYYIVGMLYDSKMNLSEILDFTVDKVIDLDLEKYPYIFSAKCYLLDKTYYKYGSTQRVFQSRFGNRVPLSRISYVFNKAIKAAGITRPIGALDIKATAKQDYEIRIVNDEE